MVIVRPSPLPMGEGVNGYVSWLSARSIRWLHSGTALHKHPDRVKRDKTEFERADNKIMHTLYLLEILYHI